MSGSEFDKGRDYARPPIVEAVIERRYTNPIEYNLVNRVRAEFEDEYPAIAQTAEYSFAFIADGAPPEFRQNPLGYRMVSRSGTDVVLATTQTIAFARLAPYPGWDNFNEAASAVFGRARKSIGYKPINRLGVRYVNRLDLPEVEGVPLGTQIADYLRTQPSFSDSMLPFMRGFTLQFGFDVQIPDCTSTMTVATVQSPVPHHNSVLLDIDIGRTTHVPQMERDIRQLLDQIRDEKNRVFESSITDRARELFR